jgi:hypothetical protein
MLKKPRDRWIVTDSYLLYYEYFNLTMSYEISYKLLMKSVKKEDKCKSIIINSSVCKIKEENLKR